MDGLFEYYSDVVPVPIEWLWYPYIPFGKLTFLQGDPGEGKSTYAVQLVALLSSGRNLPDGKPLSHPLNVIYQCCEDGAADTIKPRLIEAHADCRRMVRILEDSDSLTLDDYRIEKTIRATCARLVIIDPLQAYINGDGDMQNAVRMRKLLRSLANVADKTGAAILLIGHLNKSGTSKSLYRGLGSIDISAIARSILMLVRDPNKPDFRYVFHIKSNLAPEGCPIGLQLGKKGFCWLGACDVSLREILECKHTGKKRKQVTAMELLKELLSGGDMPCTDVLEETSAMGIASRTVIKAKHILGVTSYRKGSEWYWHLEN